MLSLESPISSTGFGVPVDSVTSLLGVALSSVSILAPLSSGSGSHSGSSFIAPRFLFKRFGGSACIFSTTPVFSGDLDSFFSGDLDRFFSGDLAGTGSQMGQNHDPLGIFDKGGSKQYIW